MIDRIEREIAGAAVMDQHPGGAAGQVDLHQVAEIVVVGGVVDLALQRVVGERGDAVERRALEVGELADAAVLERDHADIRDHAWGAEAGDQAVGLGIVEAARHRTEAARRQPDGRRHRILLYRFEVLGLEVVLPFDPVGPGAVERLAEDAFEIGFVVAVAVVLAFQPVDHLLRAIGHRQIGVEARAVEIVVGADLEVDRVAFRFQPQRGVERRVVADLGAEHHLVIGALSAAEAAGHPGLHEHGAAFEIPARHRGARRGEIVVEDRLGVIGDRQRLAVEDAAPPSVRTVGDVHGRDVDELVVHQREEALARAEGLERDVDRRDVERQRVGRRGAHRGAAVVGEVAQQHDRAVVSLPVEGLALEGEGVLIGAPDIRRKIGLERVVVEQLQVLGLEPAQSDGRRQHLLAAGEHQQPEAQRHPAQPFVIHPRPPNARTTQIGI